jgi:hypothetical protein
MSSRVAPSRALLLAPLLTSTASVSYALSEVFTFLPFLHSPDINCLVEYEDAEYLGFRDNVECFRKFPTLCHGIIEKMHSKHMETFSNRSWLEELDIVAWL